MICMLKALFRHKLINFHGRTSPVKCCASTTYEELRKCNNSQGEAEFRIRYVIKSDESHWGAEMVSRDIKWVSHGCASVPLWLLTQSTVVAATTDLSSRLFIPPHLPCVNGTAPRALSLDSVFLQFLQFLLDRMRKIQGSEYMKKHLESSSMYFTSLAALADTLVVLIPFLTVWNNEL